MAKILPFEIFEEHRRETESSDNPPRFSFIRDVIRLFKESIALSLEESDQCDDLYDE